MATGMLIPPEQALFELEEDNWDPSAICIVRKDREETEEFLSPAVIWLQVKSLARKVTALQRITENSSIQFHE